MELPNPKELKALLKVCREYGVTDITVGHLAVKLGEMSQKPATEEEPDLAAYGPSSDELAFWSAQPDPLAALQDKQ